MDIQKILQETITSKSFHRDYSHVSDLRDMYYAFIINAATKTKDENGDISIKYPLSKHLRQFVRREDDDLFEQRINNTKFHTPGICKQIMRPFNKVVRSNRVVKMVDHKENDTVSVIEKAMIGFYGEGENDGVDQFMNERFLPLSFIDPNAWFLCAFDDFDEKKEKPQPYPIVYSCKDVINFKQENDKTIWVIIKLKFNYIDKDDNPKTSDRYLIYNDDIAYEYKLIPEDYKEGSIEFSSDIWKKPESKEEYAVEKYEHKSGRVPLMRIGYVKDEETNSRTYVNPMHYEAMPLLEQFIKVSSELQLSITLHTFPKQVSYVEQCNAKGCNGGVLAGGNTCDSCSGTGKKIHTTAADIIEVPFPKRTEDMMDISKVSAYVPFPGGVMEFLDKYADKLEKKIMRMMFNSESLIQTQFNTATEAEIDLDSIHDTLHPFGNKYSEVWMFFTKLIVTYLSEKDVTVYHKFPIDLKLKNLGQLLADLKAANDSKAPSYIRESINSDIADIIYADNQDERSKLSIKNKHFPFSGKTDFEIQNIILNNLATKEKQILYANFDSIFDEIESEITNFYDMPFVKQKEKVAEKVDKIKEELTPSLNLNLHE